MCNCCCHTQCCCSSASGKPGGESTTPEIPQSTPPSEQPIKEECTCTVVFRSIRVHDTGEISKGEWSVEMSVNGTTKRWNHNKVAEDTYNINQEFRLPSCDSPITIKVGGWEKDEGGKGGGFFDIIEDNDDELSDFIATYAAPNVDPSIIRPHERRTSNAHGDYTIYYEILKICKQIKTVSRASLLSDMGNYINALKKAKKVVFNAKTEDEIVDLALNRLRRGGWDIVGVMGDSFILKGFMPIGKRERLKDIKK